MEFIEPLYTQHFTLSTEHFLPQDIGKYLYLGNFIKSETDHILFIP